MSARFSTRRFTAADSLDALTRLVNRAFARLARMGLACQAAHQDSATTAQRMARGECWVAVSDGRIVGTLVLERSDAQSPCPLYRRPQVASVHQFAVDPDCQGRGCGRALLACAERRARALGCRELALDTPEAAAHLINYYHAQGFRTLARLQWPERPYTSAVLVRALVPARPTLRSPAVPSLPWFSPHRLAGCQPKARDPDRWAWA